MFQLNQKPNSVMALRVSIQTCKLNNLDEINKSNNNNKSMKELHNYVIIWVAGHKTQEPVKFIMCKIKVKTKIAN